MVIKNPYEQAAQGMMQAGIGSLSGNKYNGLASMMTTSPAGNNYYQPNFNTINSNLTNYLKMKNDDVSNVQYGISDFVNPNTGDAMSLSSAYGNDSLPFARMVYPDGSGYEERGGTTYPIQLKGPQTWRINPGKNMGITNPNLKQITGLEEIFEMAELTDDQINFMGSPLNTPDFGGMTKEELYNKVKEMEDKGIFGFGAQEPTTIEEFNEMYERMKRGEIGNWVT